jgi:hypothetical protein
MSGSGLAQFFQEFLPKGDYSYKYETSLEETSIGPEAPPVGVVEDELELEYEYTPQEFSFPQWRKFQKQSLTIYMQKRIAPQEENNEGDASSNDDGSEASSDYQSDVDVVGSEEDQSNSEDGEEEEDEPVWDTQQQRLEGSPAKPAAAASKEKRKRIPHIAQAIHSVTRMQHIDMYTKDLSLPLCRVERISKLRTIKRCLSHPSASASASQRCPVYPGRMPRVPFLPKEEDGPLSSCFRHVLSLELVPLESESSTNTTNTKNRLRVFFYNKYAQSLQQWIDKLSGSNAISKANPLLMSLHHIPAICIIPFALDPHDWYDQQYSLEYCLCIGDVSSLKIAQASTSTPSAQQDHYQHVRLDASGNGNGQDTYTSMEIRATTVSSSNAEVILSKERLESGAITLVSPTSFVASGYQEWQRQREENIAKRAGEDGYEEEQQPLATTTAAPAPAAELGTTTQVEHRQTEETDKAIDVPKTTTGTASDKGGDSSVGGVAGSIDGGVGEERLSSAVQQPVTAVRNRIRALELTTVMDAPPKRPRLDPSSVYLSLVRSLTLELLPISVALSHLY